MFDSLRARWSAIAVRPQVSEAEQPYVTGVDALLSDEVSAQHSVQRLVEEIDRHLYLAKVTGSVYQPLASGGRAAVSEMVGGVKSSARLTCLTGSQFPATSCA